MQTLEEWVKWERELRYVLDLPMASSMRLSALLQPNYERLSSSGTIKLPENPLYDALGREQQRIATGFVIAAQNPEIAYPLETLTRLKELMAAHPERLTQENLEAFKVTVSARRAEWAAKSQGAHVIGATIRDAVTYLQGK